MYLGIAAGSKACADMRVLGELLKVQSIIDAGKEMQSMLEYIGKSNRAENLRDHQKMVEEGAEIGTCPFCTENKAACCGMCLHA